VPEGGAEGVMATSGERSAGWGVCLLEGKPVFCWNLIDVKWIKWEAPEALAPGRHTVEFDFQYDGLGVGTMACDNYPGIGKGGTGTLKVDGKGVVAKRMEKKFPSFCSGTRASTSARTPSPASTTPTTSRSSG